MEPQTAVDEKTGRKFFLEYPEDLKPDERVVFLLNLHGGGSHGVWQRKYFPAIDYKDRYRLVVATPSAATRKPFARWVDEADDEHLQNIVEQVVAKFGAERIASFWLVGHSQGGMTSNRLLRTDYFAERVDGWLSLSGGRIGGIELPKSFFPPAKDGQAPPSRPRIREGGARPGVASVPEADFSFIFATGEHEIVKLPEASPWAEKYAAGARVRQPDIVDEEAGQVYDTTRAGRSTKGWGFEPGPGTAELYIYPGARDGRVIADVVRLNKGHTEGLEPRITEELVKLIVSAPGGKLGKVVAA
ncbi:MAG: alpha/beta hydrolase [Myxococcales bacterium]|nr:alpha/beta hydrolase [Myxococcales bacterium]